MGCMIFMVLKQPFLYSNEIATCGTSPTFRISGITWSLLLSCDPMRASYRFALPLDIL